VSLVAFNERGGLAVEGNHEGACGLLRQDGLGEPVREGSNSSRLDPPGGKVSGNGKCDWSVQFPAVTTRKLRLTCDSDSVPVARIWELEVYNPK
jgi:hypothetical protein